jgi:hypothetical protein
VSDLEALARDYRTGFLRYLPKRSEAAMAAGYELGRRVASGGASLLDLVQVHHRILGEVLAERPTPDPTEVVAAGGEFLSEVLSTFEMAHRVLHSPPAPGDDR